MLTGELFDLTFLFGVWLATVATVVCTSVRREAGRLTPRVRALTRRTTVLSVGLVIGYLLVALPAFRFAPMGTSYTVIVAAFAVAAAVQGVQFWLSLVHARRLRMVG